MGHWRRDAADRRGKGFSGAADGLQALVGIRFKRNRFRWHTQTLHRQMHPVNGNAGMIWAEGAEGKGCFLLVRHGPWRRQFFRLDPPVCIQSAPPPTGHQRQPFGGRTGFGPRKLPSNPRTNLRSDLIPGGESVRKKVIPGFLQRFKQCVVFLFFDFHQRLEAENRCF